MGNKEIEECDICGMESELCGTFLTTRGKTYTKETKDQERIRNKGSILNHDNTKKNGDRCFSIQPLVGLNLLDERGYEYKLVKPVMSGTAFAERMFTKLSWEPNFRIFSTLIRLTYERQRRKGQCTGLQVVPWVDFNQENLEFQQQGLSSR